jgi:hypothetical protein
LSLRLYWMLNNELYYFPLWEASFDWCLTRTSGETRQEVDRCCRTRGSNWVSEDGRRKLRIGRVGGV